MCRIHSTFVAAWVFISVSCGTFLPLFGQAPLSKKSGATVPVTRPANYEGQPNKGAAGNRPEAATPRGPLNGNVPVQGPPPATAVMAPQVPTWMPLDPEHEKYIKNILTYWEKSSAKIQRYKCQFTRWEYDGAFGAKDEKGEALASTISSGLLMYAAPDKGMFKVEEIRHYQKAESGKATWLKQEGEQGEHWICDGKSIFTFDHDKKLLQQTELPPDMQGKEIVNGPLPFLFGAKADKIQERYWVRSITPKDTKGEYWIEAIPKKIDDAANFKMIRIILDEKEFLPASMALYPPNYDARRSPSYTSFTFESREVNSNNKNLLNLFQSEFYEPKTPSGYKKVVQGAANPPQANNNQAKKPAGKNPPPR